MPAQVRKQLSNRLSRSVMLEPNSSIIHTFSNMHISLIKKDLINILTS